MVFPGLIYTEAWSAEAFKEAHALIPAQSTQALGNGFTQKLQSEKYLKAF